MRRWLTQRNVGVTDLCCVAIIVATLTVAFSPIFASISKFPLRPKGADWFKECAFNRSARQAIVVDHQFALRSQYLGGGYPLLAYPEDSSLNPLFVTTVLFGENVGLKLRVFIKLLVGALGMYYLLRVALGCPAGGALIGSLIFGLADWFHARTGYGFIGWHNYCFLPLMMGTLVQAARGRCSVVLPSVLFALMLIDGKYVVVVSLLFLCLWGLPESIGISRTAGDNRRVIVFRSAFFWTLAMVVCLGSLIVMVKILPMLELLSTSSRSVSYGVLALNWNDPQDTIFAAFYDLPALGRALVTPAGPWEHHVGVGWIAAGLALLAAVLHMRALARWLILWLVFAWLCLGLHAPIDLWRLVWHVPIFEAMNKPAFCINFFLLLPVSVLAASVFRRIPDSTRGRWAYGLYLCIGGIAVALLLHNAFRVNAGHFTQTLDTATRARPFYQVDGSGKDHLYLNMVDNVGSIDWDGDILLPEYAVPAAFVDEGHQTQPNPEYRGEIWFAAGGGRVQVSRFSANEIAVELEPTAPATLVINQNFDRRWRSSHGEVLSHEGLLAIRDLPHGSAYTLTLKYSSPAFLIGLAVTVVSLAVVIGAWVGNVRRRGGDEPADGKPPLQQRSREIRMCPGAWSARTRVLTAVGMAVTLALLAVFVVPRLRTDYTLRRAQIFRVREDTNRAADLCRRVLRADPGNRLARDILGNCHYDEGRWQDAIDELGMAVELGDAASHTYLMLARSHRRLGQLAEAERVYRELLTEFPGRRDARREFAAFRFDLLRMGTAAQPPSARLE